jgi:hypothetical protein
MEDTELRIEDRGWRIENNKPHLELLSSAKKTLREQEWKNYS